MTTDPLIARLDALAAANATAEYRFVDGQYIAFTSALHDAWPVLRKRLEAGDAARDALAAVADQYEGNACVALRDYLNGIDSFDEVQKDVMFMADIAYAGIDAYDAANAKGTA